MRRSRSRLLQRVESSLRQERQFKSNETGHPRQPAAGLGASPTVGCHDPRAGGGVCLLPPRATAISIRTPSMIHKASRPPRRRGSTGSFVAPGYQACVPKADPDDQGTTKQASKQFLQKRFAYHLRRLLLPAASPRPSTNSYPSGRPWGPRAPLRPTRTGPTAP